MIRCGADLSSTGAEEQSGAAPLTTILSAVAKLELVFPVISKFT